jgi:hypothetical protein
MTARVILKGLGIANPIRLLRGPIILGVAGLILNVILALPLIYVVLMAGMAWGAYLVFDECYNPIDVGSRLVRGSGRGGDLADWS